MNSKHLAASSTLADQGTKKRRSLDLRLKKCFRDELPTLGAAVVRLCACAQIRRELRIAPPWINLFLAVVWWAIGHLPSWLREGGDFIHTVSSTDDGTLDTFNEEVSESGIGTISAVRALPDIEGLREAIKNIADATAELAAPVVVVAWGRLDVCDCGAAQRAEGDDGKDDAIFHADLQK